MARIATAALDAEPEPQLIGGWAGSVRLPRVRVVSLLAAAVTGRLGPRPGPQFPRVSFERILRGSSPVMVAKRECLFAYFAKVLDEPPPGDITITRHVLSPVPEADRWADDSTPLTALTLHDDGGIEDARGCLQVDFANRFLGGGVLGGGCVQEEIRFCISPELIVSMLVCPVMQDHEAVSIDGSQQFSDTVGYGRTFRFDEPVDVLGPPDTVLAIDAIPFGRDIAEQLTESMRLRELNKAYCGFATGRADVATGNWGCGVFGGSPPLKALLQWMAASASGRRVRYYGFGDPHLGDLDGAVQRMGGQTVGALWRGLAAVAEAGTVTQGAHVYDAVADAMGV